MFSWYSHFFESVLQYVRELRREIPHPCLVIICFLFMRRSLKIEFAYENIDYDTIPRLLCFLDVDPTRSKENWAWSPQLLPRWWKKFMLTAGKYIKIKHRGQPALNPSNVAGFWINIITIWQLVAFSKILILFSLPCFWILTERGFLKSWFSGCKLQKTIFKRGG